MAEIRVGGPDPTFAVDRGETLPSPPSQRSIRHLRIERMPT